MPEIAKMLGVEYAPKKPDFGGCVEGESGGAFMHDLIKELTDKISAYEVLNITIYNQSLRDYTGVHLRSEVAH